MRSIVVLALCAAACDRGSQGAPAVALETECTPMPAACPDELACTVEELEVDGEPVRVCGGTACCVQFCETNGCGVCCLTPDRRAP